MIHTAPLATQQIALPLRFPIFLGESSHFDSHGMTSGLPKTHVTIDSWHGMVESDRQISRTSLSPIIVYVRGNVQDFWTDDSSFAFFLKRIIGASMKKSCHDERHWEL
jgi:hypothetical protein